MAERSSATGPKSTTPQGRAEIVRGALARMSLLAGILCAFALRLFHLGSDSLWYDETVSAFLAQKRVAALFAHTAGDIHPPGYYLLLHYWQGLATAPRTRDLEFLLAWPSLWFGMLIVVLTYALGQRLFTRMIALFALWLAAIHPFQIWYSQEVRMYTLGAFLGLLALWATVQYSEMKRDVHDTNDTALERAKVRTNDSAARWRSWNWLAVYALCSAIGLYTLYYFFFVLLSLNIIAGMLLLRQRTDSAQHRQSRILGWLAAQVSIVLLWLPWLPIFWRQATDPPVPPWRVPWESVADIVAALSESMSTLLSGQSAPLPNHWLWLISGISLLVAGWYYAQFTSTTNRQSIIQSLNIILLYVFLPVGLLFLATAVATPLYHVRYVMLYAPLFVLWVAATVNGIYQRHRRSAILLAMALFLVNGWSLNSFWNTPQFQSDDHRAAVNRLAEEWRPGDLILVNAGWVYSALEVYWPKTVADVDGALPPSLLTPERLNDYANRLKESSTAPTAPIIVRTGSVDGSPNLGWGDPASDFFAIDRASTLDALDMLAQHHPRIWHYRLYDTVNDPNGVIRDWLATHAFLLRDEPIPGRDYLRLQLYQVPPQVASQGEGDEIPIPPQGTARGSTNSAHSEQSQSEQAGNEQTWGEQRGDLQLLHAQPASTTIAAGNMLYVRTEWQQLRADRAALATISFSLRLYDERGLQVAQQDVTPWHETQSSSPQQAMNLILALPVPVAMQPGIYTLRLLLYDQRSGSPFTEQITENSVEASHNDDDPQITLADILIEPAQQIPILGNALVSFDYVDLLALRVGQQPVEVGAAIPIEAYWRPQPNSYRDSYLLQWSLLDRQGVPVQQWEEPLGSWGYPSGMWPASLPVRQLSRLAIEPTTNAGSYQLVLRFVRQSDGQQIAPQQSWQQWLLGDQAFSIGENALLVAEIQLVHSGQSKFITQ